MEFWGIGRFGVVSALVALAGSAHSSEHCPAFVWTEIVATRGQAYRTVNGGRLPDGRALSHIVFEELSGPFPKQQMVVLVNDGCYLGAVSVGRYGTLKSTAGEELYHFDLYLPTEHRLLGASVDPPAEDEVWQMALPFLARPPTD